MGERVFVAADWRAVESRLTALFSGDKVLRAELDAELTGGPRVHALNANLLFGCAVEDAKKHKINLKGRMVPAYDGGKRVSHMWNYGAGARQGARTFWLPEKFVAEAFGKLATKYDGVATWRETLADRVFGVVIFRCPRCGFESHDDGSCVACTAAVGVPILLRYGGYASEPARIERTVFGRIRRYMGRRREGSNALTSQHPQSSGASMWDITFARLHGYDPLTDEPWPAPPGILQYDPHAPWGHLMRATPIFVATGMYDSFYLECPAEVARGTLEWLLWTMEQPWAALDGWRFPAEGFIGRNLGKYHEREGEDDDEPENLDGLREQRDIAPFQVAPSSEWKRADVLVRPL